MEKLKMHSPDITGQSIARIAELFPTCVTEAKDENGNITPVIDFDMLRQELSGNIVEGPRECYRADWPGKKDAILAANTPIAKTLRPKRGESVVFDDTRNLFIEGDNLEALKLLLENYLGVVDLIYIDPPYNTGNDFIYEDDFSETRAEYMEKSMQTSLDGNRLVANTESNGRFHSDWMSMMFARLRLAKNLLSSKGVILVSIGPEELKNMLSLLGEVFGEENRVSILTWEKGRKNDSTFFSDSAEYLIVFAKSRIELAAQGKWREKKEGLDVIFSHYKELRSKHGSDHAKLEEGMKLFYRELTEESPAKSLSHFFRSDDRGLFFGADISSASTSIPDYEICHPVTKKSVKKPARGWGATEPVMLERIENNEVLFGQDETTIPLKKSYLEEVDSMVKTPVFYKDGRAATGVLKNLFGDVIFNNPKDHTILADIFSYCLQGKTDGLVLDFFAGSSSSAHAVIEMNASDGGKRRFIMVQLAEVIDESLATNPASKKTIISAKKFLNSISKPHNISEISKERIRRAGKKIKDEHATIAPNLDIGFRVLKVDTSNMKDVYYAPDGVKQEDFIDQIDNIKEDRTPEDLLFQVLLDWGVDLSLSIKEETVEGKNVFFVDGNALAACFDKEISEELVKELATRKPLRAVFRDSGYGTDSVKINVEQIFKLISPSTDIKSI